MKNKTFNILSMLSLAVLFIYFIRVMPSLPDKVPMNIGASGNVTSWGSKSWLWLFASIPLSIFVPYKIYYHYVSKIDPDRQNTGDERIILLLIIILFTYIAILYVEMIRGMEKETVNADMFLKGIMLGMGALTIGMGNYLPRISRNRTMGIKMPWTLKNDIVWDKTHRLAGKTSVISGILMIIITLLEIKYYWAYGAILMTFGIGVIPTIYAYKLYHKLEK